MTQTSKTQSKIEKVLKNVFGFESLKPFQEEVVNSSLEGNNILVLSPTGSGKSLCYQLPSLIDKGITIIISPLRSLIYDQVSKMRDYGISTGVLIGDMNGNEKKEVVNLLSDYLRDKTNRPYKMVYTTPEMISYNKMFLNLLKELNKKRYLSRIVIDEAHCVSTWGHDFRGSYLTLGEISELLPNCPIMALTATATPKVKKDIVFLLKMKDCKVFTSSFRRTNLNIDIRMRNHNTVNDIKDLLQTKYRNKCGIIYCHSRKDCEKMAEKLSPIVSCKYYHAGLNGDERRDVQDKWIEGKVKVICATIAFGMGVDKPDVRFVIHYSMPMSMENYYQEIGRAGRDKLSSDCILFFNYQDKILYEKIIKQNVGEDNKKVDLHKCMFDSDDEDSDEEETVDDKTNKVSSFHSYQLNKLYDMVSFVDNVIDCRHSALCSYFGEKVDWKKEQCKTNCDNCLDNFGKIENKDVFKESKSICLTIINLSNKNINTSRRNVIKTLIGDSKGYKIDEFGDGKELGEQNCERLVNHLINHDYIKENLIQNKFGYWMDSLVLFKKAKKILKNEVEINLPVKMNSNPILNYFDQVNHERENRNVMKCTTKAEEYEKAVYDDTSYQQDPLFQDLFKLRGYLAKKNNIPHYQVFNNRTMKELVLKKPQSDKDLLNIYGIGNKKLEDYGSDILNVIVLGWNEVENYT